MKGSNGDIESSSQGKMNKTFWAALLLASGLVLFQGALGWRAAEELSPTFDEALHLTAGFSYWKTGHYGLNGLHHPAFAEMWAAVPLLMTKAKLDRSDPLWREGNWRRPVNQYSFADHFLYQNEIPADRMMTLSRRAMLFLSFYLAIGLFWMTWKLFGSLAAFVSVAFYALSPSILAHAGLVSTDFAFTVSYFLFFCFFYLARNSPDQSMKGMLKNIDIWMAGLFLGLSFASKYSAVAVIPTLVALAGWDIFKRRLNVKRWLILTLILSAAGILVILFVYRFAEFDIFIAGLKRVIRVMEGRSTFLWGQHSNTGWWYYFPFAFLIKTPIPLILMVFGAAVLYFRKKLSIPSEFVIPPLLFFLLACFSKVQIGHRYILPIYPFLFLAAGSVVPLIFSKRRWVLLGGLLVWQFVSFMKPYPEALAYFNEFVGGPDNGYKYLTDSNVDWGQGLKKLSQYAKKNDINSFYLCYFGTSDPAFYNLKIVHVRPYMLPQKPDTATLQDIQSENRCILAISVTNRQHSYYASKNVFSWLNVIKPEVLISRSILIYDLTHHTAGRLELAKILAELEKHDLAQYETEKAKSL